MSAINFLLKAQQSKGNIDWGDIEHARVIQDRQIEEIIDWLGCSYLDFDNNGREYEHATRKEIRIKLKNIIENNIQ